jgi:hypothetical protein
MYFIIISTRTALKSTLIFVQSVQLLLLIEAHFVTLNACFKLDEVNRMLILTRPFPPSPPRHFLSVSTAVQIKGTQSQASASVPTHQLRTVRAPEMHAAPTTRSLFCVSSHFGMPIANKSLSPMFRADGLLL